VADLQAPSVTGLSAAEVADRVRRGLTNDVPEAPSRTVAHIVKANVFTRFNALMVSLAVVPLVLREPRDALFLGVVVANALIGIVQELRAKRTLDRLAVLNAPRAHVVRDSADREVDVRELVIDDVLALKQGLQIVADAVVLDGDLEVDESLLTGEADAVVKGTDDELLSGSFVVAGTGHARVSKVGRDAYAAQLAEQARRFTLVRSELLQAVNQIVRVVTWLLVPTAILLIVTSVFFSDDSLKESLLGAVAGTVGMVPEGLVLLTSVAFAVGVVRLAKRRTLVQELPAIEVLARVDVMAVDKTGTITEGALDLVETVSLNGDMKEPLGALAAAEPDPNPTQAALRRAYAEAPPWTLSSRVPFSSARKWSAATFADHGSWVFGAPEMVLRDRFDEVREMVEEHADAGQRVLLLAHTDATLDHGLPDDIRPVGLVLFEDRIRPDAKETFAYFDQQGVSLKVISGDNPRTVAAVAQRAGLRDATRCLDARTLPSDERELGEAVDNGVVFGRVTPQQKQAMVKAMQGRGHTVAMTGDGVNDVLALKDADCGVAMASGSEATRAVAQLVLLDSNFSAMPRVVAEGRRVINNIERVASLFLTKTVYSTILAIVTGLSGLTFPFRPRHLTLISALTIGIPAFFLALAPNAERVRKGFLRRVASFAVPGGVYAFITVLATYVIARADSNLSITEERTAAVMAAGGVGFVVLARIARPLNPLRIALIASMVGAFVVALIVPFVADFFELDLPDPLLIVVVVAFVAGAFPLLEVGGRLVDRAREAWERRHPDQTDAGAPPAR